MTDRPDPTALPCACSALRMATRAVSRFYEACLAPTGTTATQYSLLRYIQDHGPTPLRALADTYVLERTSLYRAIQPLERDGLVELRTDPNDARRKLAYLTPEGAARIDLVRPYWRRAQEVFVSTVGTDEWMAHWERLETLIETMGDMEDVPP